MNHDTISGRNFRSLLILMVLCGTLVNGAFTVGQDAWISACLMGLLFLPLMLIYGRIATLYPGKGLFEMMEELLGPFGKVLILLMSVYFLLTGSLNLQNYAEFTVVISLDSTPKIPIMILLLLAGIYLAKSGTKLLGRWSFLVLIVMLSHFVVTLLLSLNILDPSHVFPVMNHPFSEISADSIGVGGVAIGDTVMTMALLGALKKDESSYKIYLPGILIGIGIFALILLRNLFILGADLDLAAQFPAYMAMRAIRVGSFFERVESFISFVYILIGITKLTVCILAGTMGVARLLKSSDYKKLIVPSALLMLAIGATVFKNVMEMFNFVWVYRYLSIPFQILIPLIVWIAAECKSRTAGKSSVLSNP